MESAGSPCITVVMIKFRANGLIVTKSFSSSLLTTNNQAKLDACNVACVYIVKNLMTGLQQLDDVDGRWNAESKDDQLKDGDSTSVDDTPDPNEIEGINKGEPFVINDGPSNMDEKMSEDYSSGSDKKDTTLSEHKNKNQLHGRKIPRTDTLLLELVQLLSKILRESKKEATAARNIHLELSSENTLIQSTGEIFHKATPSYIKTELHKETRTELCRKARTL